MSSPLNDVGRERRRAVLVLAYGGPESMAEVGPFLASVRGREVPQLLMDDVVRRYSAIGGRSPLPDIARRITARLGQRLGLPSYLGLRHSSPSIGEAVAQIAADGIEEMTAICLAPHFNPFSVGPYERALDQARASHAPGMAISLLRDWHFQPAWLDGAAASLQSAFRALPPDLRGSTRVIFSAHSLPLAALTPADPYQAALRETSQAVARRMSLDYRGWQLAFQSASGAADAWLGPHLPDAIRAAAEGGASAVVIVPISFVIDNVEVLYDLDITMRCLAEGLGLRYERCPMLNDSDALIAALADAVTEYPLADLASHRGKE